MKKLTLITVLIAMMMSIFSVFGIATESVNDNPEDYSYLNGGTFGLLSGVNFHTVVNENFDNVNIVYLNSDSDLIEAAKSGKIDAFVTDKPQAIMMNAQNPSVKYFEKELAPDSYGFIFSKNDKGLELQKQFNTFLKNAKADGTVDRLCEKWLSGSDEVELDVKPSELPDVNGKLTYYADSAAAPFSYLKNGSPVGYEVELAVLFCKENGYAINAQLVDFSALIPSITTQKCDFASGSISITEERKESVSFSDPVYSAGPVVCIYKEDTVVTDSNKLASLKGKIFGVKTGSIFDGIVKNYSGFNGNEEIQYFQSEPDATFALSSGKIDAWVTDEPIARLAVSKNQGLRVVDEHFEEDPYGFGFKKGSPLVSEFNAALKQLEDDGTIEKLKAVWFGNDDSVKNPIEQAWTGEKGTIKYFTDQTVEPMCYVKDGKLVGYEIDLVLRCAQIMGYNVEITGSDFASLIASVTSGKSDIIGGCMTITEERKKSIDFSNTSYMGSTVAVVRDEDVTAAVSNKTEESSIISSLKDSFNKTFIKEQRWKLFAKGIGTTIHITVLAAICGMILGFIVFLLCKGGNVVINKIVDRITALIQKTPTVVFLMIIYYIVFAKSEITGVWVSVIAFTLIFSTSVIGMLKMGVNAVDNGQTEAALALGYSKNKTFFKIILPQAAIHFMPTLKSEIISLIKATSIVGYVAVEDLTKMSDIVRSRTYEAFFPLIATAIIYFIIAGLLTSGVKFVTEKIDPKKRKSSKILKGVDRK